MKRSVFAVILAALLFVFSGCSNTEIATVSEQPLSSDPFGIENDPVEVIDANYGHGIDNPDPEKGVMIYDGKEVVLDYSFENNEPQIDVGLLIYVNGLRQPYYTEKEATPQFMHTFTLPVNQTTRTKIKFKPITGKKGEKLDVYICSVLNPDYVLKDDSYLAYGSNHTITQFLPWKLEMNADGENISYQVRTKYDTKAMPQELEERYISKDKDGNVRNLLDTAAYFTFQSPDNPDKIEAKSGDTAKVRLTGFGKTGKYRISFYINHKPVHLPDGSDYMDVSIERDRVIESDIELPIVGLEKYSAVCAVAVPLDVKDRFQSDSIVKTESKLFIIR